MDLLSVTSKASVFSGAIFTHLLSNQRFARHRLSLIFSSRILTQQVVWNLFPHHRFDADVPPRGIERIPYVNAHQRAESLVLTSSSSCFSDDVHHCLDGFNCGPAFPKAELVFRETVLADHVTL